MPVVQVDVARIRRITPWLKVAHLAECYNVRCFPHFLMEIHPPLACAVPTGAHLEYIPQLGSITVSNVVIADGYAYPQRLPVSGSNGIAMRSTLFASGTVAVRA